MTKNIQHPCMPINFESKCGVCLDFFDQNRKSKMLPCRHVACLTCLMKIEKHGMIKCPYCQIVHPYAVTQLPTSEKTGDILRVQTNFSSIMPHHPSKDGGEGPGLVLSFRSLFDFLKKMIPSNDHHIFQHHLGELLRNTTEASTEMDVITWIEKQTFGPVRLANKNVVPLIRLLGVVIFDWCLEGRSNDEQTIFLRRWVPIFHHFIANEKFGSLFVVFAIEEYLAQTKHPKGMMVRILAVLCENKNFFPLWSRGLHDNTEFAEIIGSEFNL